MKSLIAFSKRSRRDGMLLAAGLFVLAFGGWYIFSTPVVKVQRLTITGGNDVGLRHEFALELAAECRRHKFEMEVIASEGSEDALRLVNDGQIDLALVQGGLAPSDKPRVRLVTPLHIEPLHLLVKPQLARVIRDNGLWQLGGHSINVGPLGSGTCALAQEFLKFIDLHPQDEHDGGGQADLRPGYYRSLHQSYEEIMATGDTQQLSDAIFSISSLPSPIAKHLVQKHGFELISVPMGEAFALDAYNDRRLAAATSIDKRRIYETTIPAFTYSVNNSVPREKLKTIGTRLLVVASDRVDPDTVDRLLSLLYESTLAKDAEPAIDARVLEMAAEFPLHAGTVAYMQHNKPLVFGEVMGVLDNSLAIIATLLGGAFFISQWYLDRRQRRRQREFQRYLDGVMLVEKRLLACDGAAQVKVGELLALRQQLNDLKSDVVKRFSEGELEGEGLMLGFMTLANDARNHITRLLLHEKDNVEELAEKEHRSVEALWKERVEH